MECHLVEPKKGRFTSEHSEDKVTSTERVDKLIDVAASLIGLATRYYILSTDGYVLHS